MTGLADYIFTGVDYTGYFCWIISALLEEMKENRGIFKKRGWML